MKTDYQTIMALFVWLLFLCFLFFMLRKTLIQLRISLDFLEQLKKEDRLIKNKVSEITLRFLDDYLNGYNLKKITFLCNELRERSSQITLAGTYSLATEYKFSGKEKWLFKEPDYYIPMSESKSLFFP